MSARWFRSEQWLVVVETVVMVVVAVMHSECSVWIFRSFVISPELKMHFFSMGERVYWQEKSLEVWPTWSRRWRSVPTDWHARRLSSSPLDKKQSPGRAGRDNLHGLIQMKLLVKLLFLFVGWNKETYSAHVLEQNEVGSGLQVLSHCTSFRTIPEILQKRMINTSKETKPNLITQAP